MSERPNAKQRLVLLVFLLAPLIPLWRCLAYGEAIGAFDQINQMAPWNGQPSNLPWDVLQADSVLQFYPWRDLVFRSWSNAELPFWNPYVMAGTPLLANSQSGALYPPHILCGLLQMPTTLAMALMAWLHLAWAGLGVYVLTRRYGGRRTGALLAGLTFALSPFMISWIPIPSVITTVSWIPWVMAMLVKSARAHSTTNKVVASSGLAACVAMMVLAGHLQFVAYGLFAALVVVVVETVSAKLHGSKHNRWADPTDLDDQEESHAPRRKTGIKFLGRSVLAIAAGFALAAPQLLPVLNYSQFSHRRGEATATGYSAYVGSAIKPYSLGTLPFATLNGHPSRFPSTPDADGPNMSSYWPILDPPYLPFPESAIALGPLAFALLFLAPWRHKRRGMVEMGLIGLFALLLALGTPLNAILYYGVPGWSATGSPGRVIVLFVLAASVIGGLAIGRLASKKDSITHHLLPILLPAFLLIPCLFLTTADQNGGPAEALIDSLSDTALRDSVWNVFIATVLAGAAIAAAYRLKPLRNRAFLVASPLIICILQGGCDLVRTGHPGFLREQPLAVADKTARIAVVNDPWGMQMAAPAIAPPNTLSVAGIHDLSGYDSLIHRDTVALLRDIDGKDPAPPANGNMMFVKPTADPVKLAEAGVTEVWSRRELGQFGEPFSSDHGVFRYHVAGPGRASTPAGPATILDENSSEIRLRATGPGRLVLRDRNMPGWTATVDGTTTPVQGTTWLELDLPAGDHNVKFEYRPPGFLQGLGLFGAAAVVILVMLIPRLFKGGRKAHASKSTTSVE